MKRQLTPEWMDDPGVDPAELKEALAFIRKVNLRLGGVKALTKHLERWSANWPKGHEVSILDIATKSIIDGCTNVVYGQDGSGGR